jgi:hypothetical protein
MMHWLADHISYVSTATDVLAMFAAQAQDNITMSSSHVIQASKGIGECSSSACNTGFSFVALNRTNPESVFLGTSRCPG